MYVSLQIKSLQKEWLCTFLVGVCYFVISCSIFFLIFNSSIYFSLFSCDVISLNFFYFLLFFIFSFCCWLDFHSNDSLVSEIWSPIVFGNPKANMCEKGINGGKWEGIVHMIHIKIHTHIYIHPTHTHIYTSYTCTHHIHTHHTHYILM